MPVVPSPVGGFAGQFFDGNGDPLSSGKIYTYAAGTSTPQPAFTGSTGNTAHSNPIILDSAGRVPGGEIWLTDGLAYKITIETATSVLIGTYDNLTGINARLINYTIDTEVITATASQTVFNLSTVNYAPNTNTLAVYVDGVNQYLTTNYLETSSTQVTFTSGRTAGQKVKFTTATPVTTLSMDASSVAYTPPFTGGAATNAEVKLAQYVSVKDFGAVGDGTTDDSAAFAAARLVTARYHVPAGTYILSASPDPFLDCFTADDNVTLTVGGTPYDCSNAFAGALRYSTASAQKVDIIHAKTGNIIQYWQDGSPGTATGFYRGLAFTTDSHWAQAQPATNGGSTDILWQRSTLNADPGGNRFNETFEESSDRLIFSYATTASGSPSFDAYMRITAGTTPVLEFPGLQPRFSQGWKVTTRADGNFQFVSQPTSDRVHFQDVAGAIRHMTFKSDGAVGFFGAGGVTQPTVTGSRGANAALASLLTALAQLGLITDGTSV
jgi:hypothetical protein